MGEYPDWVTSCKTKGTCVNKRGDKYYLYRCHSERVPGTNRIRKVYDEYLGRIDPVKGLIPPKDRVRLPVVTFEFGYSSLIISVCEPVRLGLRNSYKKNGDYIFVAAVLIYEYGFFDIELLKESWLLSLLPDHLFPERLLKEQAFGIDRAVRMITDKMRNRFGDGLSIVKAAFTSLRLVSLGGTIYCPEVTDLMKKLIEKYSINEWRGSVWQSVT